LRPEQIKQKREAVVERFGPWTAHNIHLLDDEYTFERDDPGFEGWLHAGGKSLKRIVQIAADVTHQPLSSLRVLDLACLEGMYGIEFARQGAEVVGIEGRESNIEKARFAAEAISLRNITFAQDDVRNLSAEKYGHFDVVLCLGILYHLNAPDVFHFVERISEVCRRLVIIDTHVASTAAEISHTFKGHEYHGILFTEHEPGVTDEDKLKAAWASLDNEKSFWFTPTSLFNLLSNVGFTSAYDCLLPADAAWAKYDKHTLVAIKGEPQKVLSDPEVPRELWTEESYLGFHHAPAEQASAPPPPPQGMRARIRAAARRIIR
jgi:2-polyprenyl-3-methyl-5-hydroxy-6-metoxy-1,4-benzoquinol methylase